MLDDDDGVAQVPQPFQGFNQAVVVRRMQADCRLIADIEHAHQPAADLGRQADTLGFAAAESRRGTVQGQIFQADIA